MESNLLQYTYSRYWDALVHLFNTGQGVILTRNPFSHQAFVEGLYKAGYLNWDEYRRVYCKLKESSINELRKPHLIIYLDAPVSVLHDRLKARGKGEDKVITKEFLSTMENWYKTKYLKEMEVNTEVVVYDWSEPADFEVVVEDIERIDFERYDVEPRHPKFKDWHFDEDIVASEVRWKFTQQKARHMQILARVPCWDVPSLHFEQDDLKALYTVYRNAPGNFFFYPYNPKMGDKVWWKSNPKGYEPIEKTSWSNWVP
jgi:NADH dehydrogenase (ubiquinone) 1 alpha subcomplex subunit 10